MNSVVGIDLQIFILFSFCIVALLPRKGGNREYLRLSIIDLHLS